MRKQKKPSINSGAFCIFVRMVRNENALIFLRGVVKDHNGKRIKSQYFDHSDVGHAAQQMIDAPIRDEMEHKSWLAMCRKLRKALNEF